MRFWELFAAVFLFSGYCGSHLPCLWCYTELERIDRLFNEGDWLRSFPELHRLIPPVGESPCMAVPWFCDFRYSQLPAFLHTAWLGYSQQEEQRSLSMVNLPCPPAYWLTMLVSRFYDQNPRSLFTPFPVPGFCLAPWSVTVQWKWLM